MQSTGLQKLLPASACQHPAPAHHSCIVHRGLEHTTHGHCNHHPVPVSSHPWSLLQADYQLALLQHGTRLYLINMAAITRDLFYQLLLTRWEAAQVMQLSEPLQVCALMGLALQQEEAVGKWQVR